MLKSGVRNTMTKAGRTMKTVWKENQTHWNVNEHLIFAYKDQPVFLYIAGQAMKLLNFLVTKAGLLQSYKFVSMDHFKWGRMNYLPFLTS